MVELKLVLEFDLIMPGIFSFCVLSLKKKKKKSTDTEFLVRYLSELFESQTQGIVKQTPAKIKITESFETLVYLINSGRYIF